MIVCVSLSVVRIQIYLEYVTLPIGMIVTAVWQWNHSDGLFVGDGKERWKKEEPT